MSINAVKGFEIGSGFSSSEMTGSMHNDAINEDFSTATNNAGGIVGGLSNGAPIEVRLLLSLLQQLAKIKKRLIRMVNPLFLLQRVS